MKEKLSLRVMIDGNTAFSFRSSSCELVRVVLDFSSVRKKFLMKTSEDPWSFSSKVFWRKCSSSFHVFGGNDKELWVCIRTVELQDKVSVGGEFYLEDEDLYLSTASACSSTVITSITFLWTVLPAKFQHIAISFFCNNLLICINFFKFDLLYKLVLMYKLMSCSQHNENEVWLLC